MTKAELPESVEEHPDAISNGVVRVRMAPLIEVDGCGSEGMKFTARFVLKADTQTPRGT